MRKDAGELPNEEMHRTKPKSFPSARVSVPMDLGYVTLLACMCIHQPKSSVNPKHLRFLWWLHHRGMIDHLLHL